MDIFDKINMLIETQYNTKKDQEKKELEKQLCKKRKRQLTTTKNIQKMTDLEKQVFSISKIEKRCNVLIINPPKFIRLQSIFFLKTGAFIDEDLLFLQLLNNKTQQEIIKHNLSDVWNSYKNVDYIFHENKNSISLNHPEFISIRFNNQQKVNMYDGYLSERFKSYGNQIFKQFADQVDMLQSIYQDIQCQVYPTMVKQEKQELQLTGGQLNKVMNLVEQILMYYQDKPVQLFHLRIGENGMVVDPQSVNLNKCYLQKAGYNIDDAVSVIMNDKLLFDTYSFTDALAVGQLIQAQDDFYKRHNENFTIMQDFQKGVFQLSLKDGTHKDVKGKFGITKHGLNCFAYVIGEQIFDD